MYPNVIHIKCPFDGAVLAVKYFPGIEQKNVTCPICKNKYPFTQFRQVSPNAESYSGGGYNPNGVDPKTETELPECNYTLGKIVIPGSNESYQLKPGRNVIGRKASKSVADFQINTGSGRMTSREHIIIEVKNVPGKGFVHYLSLFKERVNPTRVSGQPLLYGDCIILSHGDVISLPDVDVKFVIPDDDETEI